MEKDEFEEIVSLSREKINELVAKKPLSVVGVNKEGANWVSTIEVLEREAVPDTQNLIGTYKMTFDKDHKLVGYKRIKVKRKADVGQEEEAEEEKEEKRK